MARSKVKRPIDFEEVLPLLVSTYQRGRLVPFLGAGMSFPLLHLWPGFVENLEDQARKISDKAAEISAEASFELAKADQLTGRAQRASTVLRNADDREQFFVAVRSALLRQKSGVPKVPKLTDALAAIAWPLVITTNYDDLYYGACHCRAAQGELGAEVLGRSPMDCKRVISSLNGPFDRQYIWHVQGFLGGQHPAHPPGADALRDELVVGHAEYRCVANTAAHFRRSFGEVFRTRSFLFLGSSLTEDYFLSMFSEVLELLGPGTIPHFAFTKKNTVDVEFLAAEMNITVCEVSHWRDLPDRLDQLKCAIEEYLVRTVRWSNAPASSAQSVEPDLSVVPNALPKPASLGKQEAVAFATGRGGDQPEYGGLWSYEGTLKERYPRASFRHDRHVLRFGRTHFFAVAARGPKKGIGGDDLQGVYVAMQELFRKTRDYECLHMALPHVPRQGKDGNLSAVFAFPPVYAFIEAVQAFGAWKRDHPSSRVRLVIHTAQPDVWLNLNSNRIDIGELLKFKLMPVWAVVQNDERREPSRRVLYYKRNTLLSTVLDDLRIFEPSSWSLSICPSPYRKHDGGDTDESKVGDRLARRLDQIGVGFGSILTLRKQRSGRESSR